MSIIYSTLERLEADSGLPEARMDCLGTERRPAGRRFFPVRSATIAIVLLVAGIAMTFWQPLAQGGGIGAVPVVMVPSRDDARWVPDQPILPVEPGAEPAAAPRATPATGRQEPIQLAGVTYEAVIAPEPTRAALPEKTAAPEELAEPERPAQPETPAPVSPRAAATPAAAVASAEPEQVAWAESSAVAPVQTSATDAAIEQARLALASGGYPRALAALAALDPIPENRADFWLVKGSAHLGLGQLEQAELAFASARTLMPDNAQIAVQQAILRQEQGDHPGALRILEAVAQRHPDVPEIFLNQGYSQQALGAVTEAKRSFRVFLRLTDGRALYMQQREAVRAWLAQDGYQRARG